MPILDPKSQMVGKGSETDFRSSTLCPYSEPISFSTLTYCTSLVLFVSMSTSVLTLNFDPKLNKSFLLEFHDFHLPSLSGNGTEDFHEDVLSL